MTTIQTAIASIRSVAAYIVLPLYVLLVAPPGILVALLTGKPHILYWLGSGGVRLGLTLAGIKHRAAGLEHILPSRAAVYCVNHTSNVEPPVMYDLLRPLYPRVRIMYKAELHRLPLLPRAFDVAGFVPIDRHNREEGLRAIDQAAQGLREGNSFLIFPEGTRSRSGELLPFKKGGFIMAIKAQAPIVPVAIQGAAAAMRKGSPIIRPVTVSVRFGPPIETRGRTVDDRDAVMLETRAAIGHLLAQGPVQDAPRYGSAAAV